MQNEKSRILIGKIDKLFKLKGEVKVLPFTYSKDRFFDLKKVYIDEEENLYLTILNIKIQKNGLIIKFKEINDIETAKKFLNFYLYIDREEIKELDEDSLYFFELKDYTLFYRNIKLGSIKEIYEDGVNCFFTFDYMNKEYIIPFNSDFVVNINKKEKYLKIEHFDKLVGIEPV